jgi:hypothetical protein
MQQWLVLVREALFLINVPSFTWPGTLLTGIHSLSLPLCEIKFHMSVLCPHLCEPHACSTSI